MCIPVAILSTAHYNVIFMLLLLLFYGCDYNSNLGADPKENMLENSWYVDFNLIAIPFSEKFSSPYSQIIFLCTKIEWFHTACLRITSIPRGKWFCPDCV